MSSIIRQSEIEIIVSKCVEATILAIHNRKGDDAILHGLEAGLRDVVREELSKAGVKVQRKRRAAVTVPITPGSDPVKVAGCVCRSGGQLDRIRSYLPSNFTATYCPTEGHIRIEGYDRAGWTLDDYVIPRLASGLIAAREIVPVVKEEAQ